MSVIVFKKRHKYRAKKVDFSSKIYPSKLQAMRASQLHFFLKIGRISDLQEEVKYSIDINGKNIGNYYLDFQYFLSEEKEMIYEDTKGCITPLSKFKIKIVEALYNIRIDLIKKIK